MKTFSYFYLALISGIALLATSCGKPPIASFNIQNGSAVVNESFKITNSSSGEITSYTWDFGIGEGSSSSESPSYEFKKLGNKTVSLTVTGPGGSDTHSKTITVYAMPPDCHNYNSHYNMNSGVIQNLRSQSVLEYGRITIINNYGANVKIEIYHPDSWLDEYYLPWDNCYWSVPYNAPNGNTLTHDGSYFNVGGDWGMRVTFGNGVKSCIRTIHYYSKSFVHNGIKYLKVHASDVYEGSYSWDKSKNNDEPGDMLMSVMNSVE